MRGDLICEHGRLTGNCEDCAYVQAVERGRISPDTPKVNDTPTPAREVVDVDTLIERPELGEGATTLVKSGDPIPVGLENHKRRPVQPKRR